MVLDVLAARAGLTFKSHKAGAVVAEGRLRPGGSKVVLAKPASFMNLSGGPVSQLARFFKVAADRVVVVHDDLDLDFDTVRVKVGGGHGGHNGLRDLIARLGSPEFVRVRSASGGRPAVRIRPTSC